MWFAAGRGAVIGLPIVLGYLPIAFSFGVAATKAGLSPPEAVVMSLLIYSGAAQFMAIALIAAGAGYWVIVATLVGMSLRHVMYGPSLLRHAGGTRPAWAMVWGFGLTDEVFGASLGAMARGVTLTDGFMFGLSAVSYAAWVGGTVLGVMAGASALQDWPAVDAGLSFMLTALFLALLMSILQRAQLPIIAAALLGTVGASIAVSPTAGIMTGMILGAGVGALMRGRDAG